MIGETIAGRYRIDELLGRGGMGEVYRGRTQTGKPVAIKLLRDDVAGVEQFRLRFSREVELAARVAHEHIVRVDQIGRVGRASYMVMELVDAPTLADLLDREQRLEWPRALGIAAQLLRALSALHSGGVVHRDVKPDNVFVDTASGGGDWVKLFDFGLAKPTSERAAALTQDWQELTQPGFAIGSPTYLAPERVTGASDDPRSDLYAVGVLLYEMLAGRPPFQSDEIEEVLRGHLLSEPPTLAEMAPDAYVPPVIEDVVRRALAKEPEARFSSAAEFAAHLEALLGTDVDPTVASPQAPSVGLGQWLGGSRRRVALWVGAGAALTAVVGLAAAAGDGGAAPGTEVEAAELAAPRVAAAPEQALSAPLQRELEALGAAWAKEEVEIAAVEPVELYGGECARGRADELAVTVCSLPGDAEARAAARSATASFGGITAVAMASGPAVLVLEDPQGTDPEGRRIQRLIELFVARHDL